MWIAFGNTKGGWAVSQAQNSMNMQQQAMSADMQMQQQVQAAQVVGDQKSQMQGQQAYATATQNVISQLEPELQMKAQAVMTGQGGINIVPKSASHRRGEVVEFIHRDRTRWIVLALGNGQYLPLKQEQQQPGPTASAPTQSDILGGYKPLPGGM